MTVALALLGFLRSLLALAFVVSAFAKLVDNSNFRSALGGFAVPERLRASAAVLIPLFELAITSTPLFRLGLPCHPHDYEISGQPVECQDRRAAMRGAFTW